MVPHAVRVAATSCRAIPTASSTARGLPRKRASSWRWRHDVITFAQHAASPFFDRRGYPSRSAVAGCLIGARCRAHAVLCLRPCRHCESRSRLLRDTRFLARCNLHYAIKANPMPALVRHMAQLVDGLDVASGRELAAALDHRDWIRAISASPVPARAQAELAQAVAPGILLNVESPRDCGRSWRSRPLRRPAPAGSPCASIRTSSSSPPA